MKTETVTGQETNKGRIRVLFVVSTLARQGPVCQLYNQLKYMNRNKFEPSILTLSPEPEDSLLPDFRTLGVPCYSLGLSRSAGLFFAGSRLRAFLHSHHVDIIHSSNTRAVVLSAFWVSRVPRIATKHEMFYISSFIEHGVVLGWLFELIYSIALGRLEPVVCVSEYVRATAPGHFKRRTVTIRNGADMEVVHPPNFAEKMALRERLGLPPNRYVFISVGSLSPRKDPITVMKGFLSSIAAEGGTLVFLGDGPLRGECERMADGRNNVRIVGAVSNVADYLRAADVLVSGSLAEGLPMAVIEAMACGVPVVLSDIGPHREILAFNPMAGKLFPVKDVPALATCLQEITNNDYPSRSEAAFQIVQQHLNARRMSAEYQALYVECLE